MKCFLDFNNNTTPNKPTNRTRPLRKTKMFCKVCKDTGKKESEYTSHWVRDAPGPSGKVVCPTLLSTECNFCKARGHTIKFCTKIKVRYSRPPVKFPSTNSQEAPQQLHTRARELCSSPPPAPQQEETQAPYKRHVFPVIPTSNGIKNNYFGLLKVYDHHNHNTKDTEINNYKKNLEKNFPALGEEKTMKIVKAIFPDTATMTTAVKSYSSVANTTMKYEREDSPTPSPVSSHPTTPPPAPKKMPRVKEVEERSKCDPDCPSPSSSTLPHCMGTPSLSPTPPPMTTSWADMEVE